jgi:outer membrane lipoprotein-sorting protein
MKKIILSVCLGISILTSTQVLAQTTEEILTKHEAAMGSSEKWAAIKTAIVKNKFSVQGMDIESKTSMVVGKSFRTEIEVMGNKIITAIDGDKGWMIRPAMMGGTGEPEDMPSDQVKMADSQKQLGSALSGAKASGAKIELVSKEKLDGADAFLLSVTKTSGETMQVYVSASTYFILKTTAKVKANGQEIDAETNYSNYKAVDGLYFPFTVEAASPMGGMMQIDTTGVELNASLDPSIFARPKK